MEEQKKVINFKDKTGKFVEFIGGLGLWSWDTELNKLDWNSTMYDIYERDKNYVVDNFDDFGQYVHEEDFPIVSQKMEESLKNKTDFFAEFRIKTNGKVKYISSKGRLEGMKFLGSNIDITDKINLIEEINEEKLMFEEFFDASSIGLAIVDTNGCFVKVNQSFCDISGRSEDSLMGNDFKNITHPDDLNKDVGYVNAMLMGEISSYKMKKRYIRQNGSITWVELTVTSSRHKDGKIKKFFAQIIDINDEVNKSLNLISSVDSLRGYIKDISDQK